AAAAARPVGRGVSADEDLAQHLGGTSTRDVHCSTTAGGAGAISQNTADDGGVTGADVDQPTVVASHIDRVPEVHLAVGIQVDLAAAVGQHAAGGRDDTRRPADDIGARGDANRTALAGRRQLIGV